MTDSNELVAYETLDEGRIARIGPVQPDARDTALVESFVSHQLVGA